MGLPERSGLQGALVRSLRWEPLGEAPSLGFKLCS